ncbi:NAD-dependent epimerase/dehydratase family protein [Archangium lansingense]|uniref:GDP-mannose 4,6-dehydratase n=1 Tax=Archangium lansingense TaxID=2995310 RepID=A0ABT4AKC4_9BACT|nr:NAD-dependent epimerase/dehydratase family protein [Archangium lansinium]MCY1082090.1 GDP-mannose 4,6-dehydratase [Archangium lansinium]
MNRIHGKRVVVLGGAGFLGSHLCERLLADGASEVISLDNFITGDERNLAGLRMNKRFMSLHHDITEPFSFSGPVDYVFNMASPASPIDCARLPIETLRVGALGTENGLRLAHQKDAVFLQASTSELCGESNPIGPRSCYDEAKRYGEALVAAYRRAHGVRTRIVRIFNTYGPRMRLNDGRAVPAFLGQALRGEDFIIFGDGSQTRSFCYVSDLLDGLVRLAMSEVEEPINLGNPRETTLLQFAEAMRAAMGGQRRISFKPLLGDEPNQRQPDISRARKLLGWEPRVRLEDGLRETLTYFRSVAEHPAPVHPPHGPPASPSPVA